MERERAVRIRRVGLCLCLFVALVALLVLLLVRGRRESQLCFAVDVLRERVPHTTPPPIDKHARPPFAVGTLCFDEQQQLVEWRLQETFQFAYGLRMADVRLHGPLAPPLEPSVAGPEAPKVAPAVLTMGLSRDSKQRLSGSTVIDMRTLSHAVAHPELYYVALFVTNQHATAQVEAGRSPLLRSNKR